MKRNNIEEYLIDLINQKYAKRVFSQVATEHETQFLDLGKTPNRKEYEWMVARAIAIHREMNITEGEDDAGEKAEDTVSASGGVQT